MIEFVAGEFVSLRATVTFNFGPLERDIRENSIVGYDGQTARFGREEKECPQLILAVKNGWLVAAEDTTTKYVPQPAGVQVHAAQSTGEERAPVQMTSAHEEEAVVGTLSQSKEQRAASQRPAPVAPAAPVEVPLLTSSADPTQNPALAAANAENSRRMQAAMDQPVQKVSREQMGGALHGDLGEDAPKVAGGKYAVLAMDSDQGVVVGAVKSSSKGATVGEEGVARRVEGTDITKVTPAAVDASVQAQEGVIMGAKAKTSATPHGIRNAGAQVVAERPDISLLPVSVVSPSTVVAAEGNTDIHETLEGGATGDVAELRSGAELGDLLPDAAVAGLPPKPPAPKQSREEAIAEIVEGWDKARHWQHRANDVVDFYGDSPDIVDAICGVESPGVARQIKARVKKMQSAPTD